MFEHFCFLDLVLLISYTLFCYWLQVLRHLPFLPSLHISVWGMNSSGCEYIIRLRPDGDMLQPRTYVFFPFDPRLGNHGSGPCESNWLLIFGLTDSFNPMIWLSHMAQAIFCGKFWLCTGREQTRMASKFLGLPLLQSDLGPPDPEPRLVSGVFNIHDIDMLIFSQPA